MSTARESRDWLGILEASTKAFADVVEHGDPDTPLRYCPGWTLCHLANHLGGVHQWAAHAAVAGDPRFDPAASDVRGPAQARWYREIAGRLIDILAERSSEAHAWTMEPGNATAGFWRRRQVHEVGLHLWDAEDALGSRTPMDPEVAWDGVLEVADVLYPRQVRLERVEPLDGAVRLEADDVTAVVTIGHGDSIDVHGSAEVLLRALWHRTTDDEMESIDPRALSLLAGPVTP